MAPCVHTKHPMIYILLAFSIGVFIVLSMMISGRLSVLIGMTESIAINYATATVLSLILTYGMLSTGPNYAALTGLPPPYFIGGALGILTTFIANLLVQRLSPTYIVALRLVGQLLAGCLIDYLYFDVFSAGKVVGALFFLLGVLYNSSVDRGTAPVSA